MTLLTEQNFTEFIERLGEGSKQPKQVLTSLSNEAKQERKPLSPVTLVDAQNEPIHVKFGRLLAAKPLRPRDLED